MAGRETLYATPYGRDCSHVKTVTHSPFNHPHQSLKEVLCSLQ